MKTYFINRIQNHEVSIIAGSINELAIKSIAYCDEHFGGVTKIYVHCSNVCSTTNMELSVDYVVTVNNQKRTITTRRI